MAKAQKSSKSANPTDASKPAPTAITDVKTSRHASRYLIIGIILAIFNFGTYTLIARLIINNNDLLWLSNLIATALTTILAYILHSRITWKERTPDKSGIYKFFIWNILLTFPISPGLTWLFGLPTAIYNLIYDISTSIHLPFDYAFIESTSIFILVNIIIMIMNFLFYDRFVFGKSKNKPESPKTSK